MDSFELRSKAARPQSHPSVKTFQSLSCQQCNRAPCGTPLNLDILSQLLPAIINSRSDLLVDFLFLVILTNSAAPSSTCFHSDKAEVVKGTWGEMTHTEDQWGVNQSAHWHLVTWLLCSFEMILSRFSHQQRGHHNLSLPPFSLSLSLSLSTTCDRSRRCRCIYYKPQKNKRGNTREKKECTHGQKNKQKKVTARLSHFFFSSLRWFPAVATAVQRLSLPDPGGGMAALHTHNIQWSPDPRLCRSLSG